MSQVNGVKEKLNSGSPVIGAWSIISSSHFVEIAAVAGLDFQILDMEHGMYDLSTITECIRACELSHCSPLVRVPVSQLHLVQNCLDMGAHGIVLPQVKSYEETVKFVHATKFAPHGNRGFNPFTPASGYHPQRLNASKLNDAFGLAAIIIENKEAYQALDKILKIPDLDLLYLGVYDMSVELGYPGEVQHPEVLAFVASAISRIKAAGKFLGVMAMNEADMQKYLNMGVNFIVYGVDSYNYYNVVNNGMKIFKRILGTSA